MLGEVDFRQIAEEFSRRLEEKLVAMWRAWQTDDLDELAALAHWLKGSGGTAGFDAFTWPATTLEELARQRNRELIPAAIQDLRQMACRIALPLPAGMDEGEVPIWLRNCTITKHASQCQECEWEFTG